MLTMNSDSCHITGNVIITVNARSIRAEVRASDSGVNLKIYAVGLRLIYYLVRFGLSGSVHNITGQLGISAYTFDDSNRAFASVRVGLRRIRPIFRQEDDGSVRRTAARMVEEDVGTSNEPLKLKFILYKYVFENWEDETKNNVPLLRKFPDIAILRTGLRPTAEVLASGRLTVARYNENIPRTIFLEAKGCLVKANGLRLTW
ncbi:hypothetical protein BD770DRAFT_453394 [Pilaira anomala]|nr:hypothetical protein BD770DRAFT_453394 [Pilaira anomala]